MTAKLLTTISNPCFVPVEFLNPVRAPELPVATLLNCSPAIAYCCSQLEFSAADLACLHPVAYNCLQANLPPISLLEALQYLLHSVVLVITDLQGLNPWHPYLSEGHVVVD
jgi:hypothetical protein